MLGRPLKFKSVKELQNKIDAYFKACDQNKRVYVLKNGKTIQIPDPKPYTITGLALVLDTTRETLCDYGEKDGYSDTIRRAKLRCENYAEESLWRPKVATGVIFNLINNYGWKNQQNVDHTTLGQPLTGYEKMDDDKLDKEIERLERSKDQARLRPGGKGKKKALTILFSTTNSRKPHKHF